MSPLVLFYCPFYYRLIIYFCLFFIRVGIAAVGPNIPSAGKGSSDMVMEIGLTSFSDLIILPNSTIKKLTSHT